MALAPPAFRPTGLNEILRTQVGSGAQGVAITGTDDRDEMGVFIEHREQVYGLSRPQDTYIWRSQPEGHRSGPGDLDLVAYSLRHFLRLATKGSPTVLVPLFVPESDVIICDELGAELRAMRHAFLSQQALERFLGYMHGQHERMMGRGKQNRVPNRPELIEAYGWDTKYGAHALRLAWQAYEIATTGDMVLPIEPIRRGHLLDVKTGKYSRDEVSDWITKVQAEIRDLLDTGQTVLPERPALGEIERWSVRAHELTWLRQRMDALEGRA